MQKINTRTMYVERNKVSKKDKDREKERERER